MTEERDSLKTGTASKAVRPGDNDPIVEACVEPS